VRAWLLIRAEWARQPVYGWNAPLRCAHKLDGG
jgi:hypothetical protein